MQRLAHLAWTIGGLLAVGVAAILLVDLSRAATTGPRWRRRLLGAGLWVLGLLAPAALGSCAHAGRPADDPPVRTCYAPVEVPPEVPPPEPGERLNQLEERLQLLESMAASGQLRTEVVRRVLAAMEAESAARGQEQGRTAIRNALARLPSR